MLILIKFWKYKNEIIEDGFEIHDEVKIMMGNENESATAIAIGWYFGGKRALSN